MAYQQNKPEANDLKSQSQADIQGNFAAIQTFLEVNHETFADANEGKHKHVTFPEQGADPATAADEVAIYSKLSAVTADTGLFFRKESSGDVVECTAAVKAASGYTMLPSGLKIAWGIGTINTGSQTSANVTFNSAFSVIPYSVQLTPYNAQTGAARDYVMNVVSLTTAVFKATRNASYVGTTAYFYYLAIGI